MASITRKAAFTSLIGDLVEREYHPSQRDKTLYAVELPRRYQHRRREAAQFRALHQKVLQPRESTSQLKRQSCIQTSPSDLYWLDMPRSRTMNRDKQRDTRQILYIERRSRQSIRTVYPRERARNQAFYQNDCHLRRLLCHGRWCLYASSVCFRCYSR
jgi:hypothetical protein